MRQGRLIATGAMLVFCLFAHLAIFAAVADGPPGPRPGLLSVLAGADRHRPGPRAAGLDVARVAGEL